MALADIWESSPEQLADKRVPQIIAFAGDGKLGQGKPSSREFRDFLQLIPSDLLKRYITECVSTRFDGNGYALQDLINELGRRLGFDVVFGRYRGAPGHNGFDGIWKSNPDGRTIVIEVKTTDSYSLNLDAIAGYRRTLIQDKQTTEDRSSILLVVGREDTGGLEAQIRGSRHAWDVRLISTTSLLRLLHLKESLEDSSVVRKIRSILTPQEFTKVDGIVDIVFLTNEDLRDAAITIEEQIESSASKHDEATVKLVVTKQAVANFSDGCIEIVQKNLGHSLVKNSRTIYKARDARIVVCCLVSKEYKNGEYWFGYRDNADDVLATAPQGFLALGCGEASNTLLIPYEDLLLWRDELNKTVTEKSSYWHIKVIHNNERWFVLRNAGKTRVDVTRHLAAI